MVNLILYILAVNYDPDVSFLSRISTMADMYIIFSLIYYNKKWILPNQCLQPIFSSYSFIFLFKGSGQKKLKNFYKATTLVLKFSNKERSHF